MLGQACAIKGQAEEAQKVLARVTEEKKSHYISPYAFAVVLTGLGDKVHAIE
jgi:hypothetical protein